MSAQTKTVQATHHRVHQPNHQVVHQVSHRSVQTVRMLRGQAGFHSHPVHKRLILNHRVFNHPILNHRVCNLQTIWVLVMTEMTMQTRKKYRQLAVDNYDVALSSDIKGTLMNRGD